MRTEDHLRQQRTSRANQALSAEQARTVKQARATAVTVAASLLVLTAALGYLDDTGLFAPENWVDAWAAGHGIYTVLDMHQDTYSKYVTASPGTTCRLGATPEFGNDGAPAWATLTDGAKGCGFQGRDLSPNVEQFFTNLYDNTGGSATSSPTPGAGWRTPSPATPRWRATTC
jgi:hypothetical protein